MQVDPSNYDISQLKIQFGADFQENSQSFIKAQFSFSSEDTSSLISSLKNNTNLETKDLNYKFAIELNVLDEKQEELSILLEQLLSNFQPKTIKSTNNSNKLIIIVSLDNYLEKKVKRFMDFLCQNGLKNLTLAQKNSLQLNWSSPLNFEQIFNSIIDQETFFSSITKNCKFEFRSSLHKEFYTQFSELISKIDDNFVNSPIMLFLCYFKNLDLDLRFESINEIELEARKILFGESLEIKKNEQLDFLLQNIEYLLINGEGKVVWGVEGLMGGEIIVRMPGFKRVAEIILEKMKKVNLKMV